MARDEKSHDSEEHDLQSKVAESLLAIVRSQYEWFSKDFTQAPNIVPGPHRSLGIDNQQRCQHDLAKLRELLSPRAPIVQVIGDSGMPFDDDKLPVARAILTSLVANGAAIEYGFTASKYDTNWLVNDYKAKHPGVTLIANVVEQATVALQSGMEASENISRFVVVFDRLSPTRYGDDIWLSDGIMSREREDKMLCFEGGPQALYQCSNALLKRIQVVAVTSLRPARFSAARFLIAFKTSSSRAKEYLEEVKATPRQSNVAGWCLASWEKSDQDLASLIVSIDAETYHVSSEGI